MQLHLTEAELLEATSQQWGMALAGLRPDIPLTGSPERTVWRQVVEGKDGRCYVLERIASHAYARKRFIIDTLNHLHAGGLMPVAPYLPDVTGERIPLITHGLWQLSPYVPGVELDRPAYVMDGWRGSATADFLIQLDAVCARYGVEAPLPPFSVSAYIRDLFAALSAHDSDTADVYRPFFGRLEQRLFPVLDGLPTRFCHGDYHPLNIIWGTTRIRSVIDWEFCGMKPESYDLATLLGCIGMEDPQSLSGPFAYRLIHRLRKARFMNAKSWETLPDMVLAIRFAWLSEWMRKNDRSMIRMEADYMSLLVEHGPVVKLLGRVV